MAWLTLQSLGPLLGDRSRAHEKELLRWGRVLTVPGEERRGASPQRRRRRGVAGPTGARASTEPGRQTARPWWAGRASIAARAAPLGFRRAGVAKGHGTMTRSSPGGAPANSFVSSGTFEAEEGRRWPKPLRHAGPQGLK
jgi:hypothetical protein